MSFFFRTFAPDFENQYPMRRIFSRSVFVAIVLLCAQLYAVPAFAWGQKGHRIIAKIAYDHLSRRARRNVDAVLGEQGMIYLANWADEIKSDTIYSNSYDWHFQDFPSGLTKQDIFSSRDRYPAEGGNMFRALDSLKQEILNHKSEINPHTLRFLIHLSGDLYCPMHMAHMDDRGGNDVHMKWFGCDTRLHTVWDERLVESQGYSYTEYAAKLEREYEAFRKPLLGYQWSEKELIWNTYQLTEQIYAYQPVWDGNTYHYIYRWRQPMEYQLYVAGIRLAKLLNELYR